jgi:ATP-dependent DNA ligase
MTGSGAEATGPFDLPPMEARLVDDLPAEPGWQFEPKWDGFRCLAFRAGNEVELRAKSGKPLARYFPEMAEVLRRLEPSRFVLDGELAIPVGETVSFDALQMRLHPAESRIKKLAAETPSVLILFDLLATPGGESLLQTPLLQRREALDAFFRSIGPNDAVRLSPFTRDTAEARRWLETSGGALDGVIAKRLDGFTSTANARCSRSRNGAPRIASSAGSATSGIPRWSALCSSASTTARASSTTSGLQRPCTTWTASR